VRRARARQATAIFCEMRRLNCNAARRAPRMARQQRLQPRPLTITEVMPLQPVIIHCPSQAETTHQDLQDTL